MELFTPSIGTLFWMLLFFSIILWILKKFAWKPILNSLKERERSIEEALSSAEKAKEQMAKLKAENQKILTEAKVEREKLLKEAKELKDKIIAEAQEQAQEEAKKIMDVARQSIENEKLNAINEIKTQITSLSLVIAEKIIKEKLDEQKHKELIDSFLNDIKIN